MQIPLELKLPVKAELADYTAENKQEISSAIRAVIETDSHRFLYIWGKPATGKTHLLSALCSLAESEGLNVIYLPLKQADELSPEICDGLESADIICIDDVDSIKTKPQWEQAIFHLYNRARDADRKLVISSSQSPVAVEISLADLKSRMAWGITLALKPLTDIQKKNVLQQRASRLGMELSDETANYLLHHHSRTMNDLMDTLDKLDRASLAAQRKLTIPFVKAVLNQPSLS